MNAHQRRKYKRRVWSDHHRWPLGTLVQVLPGHHSPDAVGLVGKVSKHGYPCEHRVNCIVEFGAPVVDVRFCDTARYCHYVDFKNIQKAHKNG